MKSATRAIALAAVGLVVGALGVNALREATLSTHDAVPEDSRAELVFTARAHEAQRSQTLEELVEALVLACRLEVDSDVVGRIEHDGHGTFRATLAPALDQTNRRQFRGCLEDWTIAHLVADVVSLQELPAPATSTG